MFSISKCIRSFRFAFKGILIFFKNENNAKVHLLASIVAVILGFVLKIAPSDWRWIMLAIALVWITEATNTAVEKLVNLVSPEYNRLAGEVKDLAAGAVLLAALFAFVIGILVFFKPILELFEL